jgi:hypothetical protein
LWRAHECAPRRRWCRRRAGLMLKLRKPMTYQQREEVLLRSLGIERRPLAITFQDAPPEREGEPGGTLAPRGGLGYVRMEEIPGVFRLARTMRLAEEVAS